MLQIAMPDEANRNPTHVRSSKPQLQRLLVSCTSAIWAYQPRGCSSTLHRHNRNISQCCSLGRFKDMYICAATLLAFLCMRVGSRCENACAAMALHPILYITAQPQAVDLSSNRPAAMIPFPSTAKTSSQFQDTLNCQLFTQVITVAVILCKYSR